MDDWQAKDAHDSYYAAIHALRRRHLGVRTEHIGDATLYLGDCLEILPTLGKVDAVVTDPPYGIGIARTGRVGGDNRAQVTDYGVSDWDDEPCSPEIITQILQCSKWQIIFGGNYFSLPPSPCWLVWDKHGTGNFAQCELAWTNLSKPVQKIDWMWMGYWRKGGEDRFHPTQKPLGVMKWCISHLPESVETIIDPMMGSGTTLVAAIAVGKKCTGIERDPRYFEIALERVRKAYAQPDLFIPQPKPVQEPLL